MFLLFTRRNAHGYSQSNPSVCCLLLSGKAAAEAKQPPLRTPAGALKQTPLPRRGGTEPQNTAGHEPAEPILTHGCRRPGAPLGKAARLLLPHRGPLDIERIISSTRARISFQSWNKKEHKACITNLTGSQAAAWLSPILSLGFSALWAEASVQHADLPGKGRRLRLVTAQINAHKLLSANESC